jgi:hypothetical protein
MNTDPITAVSGSFSGDPMKRFSSSVSMERVDLSAIDPSSSGGAYLKNAPKLEHDPATSSMNLQNLRTVVADGMQNGFTRRQIDAVAAKFEASEKPGSSISQGELAKDMVVLSGRLATADAFSKAATKLSESLMTIVKG